MSESHNTNDNTNYYLPHNLVDRELDRICCEKVQVKKSDKSDFILFIRSGYNGSQTTLASADTCQLDLDTNRPIAGSITILSAMKYIDYNPGELKRVIIHELGHTFGFDYRLFPYLRHDDGSPRTKRNQHTGEPELSTNANEGLKADRNTIKYVSRTWHTVSGENTYKRVALTLPSVVVSISLTLHIFH
ncbi:hypothetical protein MS3_00010691 [Schistosoma haematobium]|uniref:Leishmanolysin-like peptidase n=1 Tax=Schistosoma haematobium TaxID=6185 RepID=A0A922IHS9_SCHHA|nr:uncharacterized protein MS3_00010691 [Schistosoma haematobium]KAH9578531.1 hypothetical protein MS3_00010691 [Schistosoma haematobium]